MDAKSDTSTIVFRGEIQTNAAAPDLNASRVMRYVASWSILLKKSVSKARRFEGPRLRAAVPPSPAAGYLIDLIERVEGNIARN